MVLPIIYSNVLQSIHSVDEADVGCSEGVSPVLAQTGALPVAAPAQALSSLRLRGKFRDLLEAGIAAEIIGIPAGSIGRMFYDAKVYFNTVDLFAWTVIVVVISVLFEKGFLACCGRAFERWKHCE